MQIFYFHPKTSCGRSYCQLVSILYICFVIRRVAPDINNWVAFRRALGIWVVSLFYSVIIGIFFINFTAEKMLLRSTYLKDYYRDVVCGNAHIEKDLSMEAFCFSLNDCGETDSVLFDELKEISHDFKSLSPKVMLKLPVPFMKGVKITVLPGMLLFRSGFALFIGVFIHLGLQSRKITEPL